MSLPSTALTVVWYQLLISLSAKTSIWKCFKITSAYTTLLAWTLWKPWGTPYMHVYILQYIVVDTSSTHSYARCVHELHVIIKKTSLIFTCMYTGTCTCMCFDVQSILSKKCMRSLNNTISSFVRSKIKPCSKYLATTLIKDNRSCRGLLYCLKEPFAVGYVEHMSTYSLSRYRVNSSLVASVPSWVVWTRFPEVLFMKPLCVGVCHLTVHSLNHMPVCRIRTPTNSSIVINIINMYARQVN